MLSELEYFKYHILFIYGLIFSIFMGAIIIDGVGVRSFVLISSIIFFITTARYGSIGEKEKRERMHALLPISVKTIGKQRLLGIILFQTGISLAWFALLFAGNVHENPGIIWSMVSTFMFNLVIVCSFIIGDDLDSCGIKFHKPILVIINTCLIILYVFQNTQINSPVSIENNMLAMLKAYSEFFIKPVGALIMSFLVSIFCYIDYKIYINRRSYLS